MTDLAKFVDDKYYETTKTTKSNAEVIRSETSCRLDLRRREAKFEKNTQHPYFEGQERSDIIEHRKQYISYSLKRKYNYYRIQDGDTPTWQIPTQRPTVLIFHNESTFYSGDVSHKRWIINEQASFFNKGQGRSHMISDSPVCHPSGPFFSLTESEFNEASRVYPNLLVDNGIHYDKYSATVGINLGYDLYFDNAISLSDSFNYFLLRPNTKDMISKSLLITLVCTLLKNLV